MSDALALRDVLPVVMGFRARCFALPPEPEATPPPDLFALGLAEGQRLAEEMFARERAEWRALIAGLEALRPEPNEPVAQLLAATVARLVGELVGDAPVDRQVLLERCRGAVALAGELEGERVLHLHPADAALLADAALPVRVEADAGLARGDVRLALPEGCIEDGVSVRLARLRELLGDAA